MEYFLKGEAEKVLRDFSISIGQDMVYNTEGDKAKLTSIEIQQSQEILHMGQIHLGYLVRFVFGLAANINQVDFCIYNGLEPVNATKHALTEETKKQIITHNNMNGSWSYTNGENLAEVEISDKEIKIETFFNGIKKSDTISTQGSAWMGALVFDNTGYYINYATETNLNFGRDYPEDKWSARFIRKE